MASVHLSISKHSVIFPLHRRRGHFFLRFSYAPICFPHLCFSLSSPAFSTVSFIFSKPLFFRVFLLSFHLSFSPRFLQQFFFLLLVFHSTFLFNLQSPSSAPFRLLCSRWNSSFSNKTKLPTASNTD